MKDDTGRILNAQKGIFPNEERNMTDKDLRALSVRCPLCGAHIQELCRNEQGTINKVPHIARLDVYDRKGK